MASGASCRRSFEYSAIVTAFAVNTRMAAGQGKSSRKVIEAGNSRSQYDAVE